MNAQSVQDAMEAATTFLKKAENVLDEVERRKGDKGYSSVFYGSKETGALRRASMDLTRALADLRKPN